MTITYKRLTKKEYGGRVIHFEYDSDRIYRVLREGDSFLIHEEALPSPIHKTFDDKLFEPHWSRPQAVGAFDGAHLAGVLEWCEERWCGRLRITNLCVEREYRRQGIGASLMARAHAFGSAHGFRELVLECQNINAGAIAFYKRMGFSLQGLDVTQYRMNPEMAEEIRFEMMMAIG